MNKKKTIIAIVVVLLALALIVGGIFAYFTDTQSATNTFTIGNVDITLTEDAWDPANGQNVTPGQTIAKDPTIENTSTSQNPVYIFAKVDVPYYDSADVFTYDLNTGWVEIADAVTGNTHTHVYAYEQSGSMKSVAYQESATVFNNVTVRNLANNTTVPNDGTPLNVVVTGYGIQVEGLPANSTPSSIWGQFGVAPTTLANNP